MRKKPKPSVKRQFTMERTKDSIIKRIDWWTVMLFALLATMGWLAICGSTHSYIDNGFADFFNQGERSGKQAMWMGISLIAGFIMLCIPKLTYRNLSVIIYAATMLLGIITIFIATTRKDNRYKCFRRRCSFHMWCGRALLQ